MRALILGVGDAFTARFFCSGALVEGPRGYVLIDCGDLIHRAIRSAARRARWRVDASMIDDIIVTHLHGDHCNGLESFGFMRWLLRARSPDRPRPRLHVTAPVAERLWERLGPAMDGRSHADPPRTLADFFDLRRLRPGVTAHVAGLAVRCRYTRHPIATIGLLLSEGRRTLGWSGDTPFDPAHIRWLSRANLIVHEANHGPAHTHVDALNSLPAELRRRIRLIHLPDNFRPGSTTIRALREGEVLRV
jgi:ribonuclease BN (tRNA processing enzyme)